MSGGLCALGCEVLYGLSYLFTKRTADAEITYAMLLSGAAFYGLLALSEPLHIGQIVGAAVIVAGVYTANRA